MAAKSALVLGAGIYQVPLIRHVQDRGMRAIVLSIPGPYPGIALADEFVPVNTTDERGVVQVAHDRGVSAVLTTGTDVALRSLGAVVDELGLPGPSYETAFRATNKLDMKRALAAGDVRTARFVEVRGSSQAEAAWDELLHSHDADVPWNGVMAKCPDRSGSRGIVRACSRGDARSAIEQAIGASLCGYALMEEFVKGHEIGVDGYVDERGSVALMALHDKVVMGNGSTNVPVGHRMSAGFTKECLDQTDIAEQVARTARAVGMRSCFYNMDVLVDDAGRAWVIEVGVRAGATCIPEVVGGHLGFDYYDAMVDAALGEQPVFPRSPLRGAAEGRLLLTTRPAVAAQVDIASVLSPIEARHGLTLDASLDYAPDEDLPRFENGTSRIGQVTCVGDEPAAVSAAVDEASVALVERYAQERR